MNKRKKSRLLVFITIALLICFIWTLIDQQRILYAMNNEKKMLDAKMEEEKKLNEELKNQKEMINSDDFIEKMAREKLGMVKKEEKIFVDTDK